MAPAGRAPPLAFVQLSLAMLSSQVASALAKNLFAIARPQDVLALRLVGAGILLCVFYRTWRHDRARAAPLTIALCAVSLFALNGLFYLAIQRLNIGVVVALEFVGPLALAVAMSRRLLDLVWVGFAASGLLLLDLHRGVGPTLDRGGAALALAAGAAWAAYIVFGKRAGRRYGRGSAAPTVVVASLLALPFAVLGHGTQPLGPALPRIAVIALLSSAVPVALEMSAMPKIPVRAYSVFMCLSPALAALAAWAVAGERLDAAQVVAILLIIVAAAGSTGSSVGRVDPLSGGRSDG